VKFVLFIAHPKEIILPLVEQPVMPPSHEILLGFLWEVYVKEVY
jgi:hypothetical protein